MYTFIPYSEIAKHMPEIIAAKVSIRARQSHQFVDTYRSHGTALPSEWQSKRNAFIARTYAAYKLNPTRRRYLSLICWAFRP